MWMLAQMLQFLVTSHDVCLYKKSEFISPLSLTSTGSPTLINAGHAEFISGNIKNVFAGSLISQSWTSTWNVSSRTYSSHTLNIMAADVLAIQVTKHKLPWYWSSCPGIFWSQDQKHINGQLILTMIMYPGSKVHGANMGPTWVLWASDGPPVGPMNLVISVILRDSS